MRLGETLMMLPMSVSACPTCRALVDDTGCAFCRRDSRTLCVVFRFVDLLSVDRATHDRATGGMRFFVLGKLLSPLEGVDASDLPLDALRAAVEAADEVVLALPASVDGEATALFLAGELASKVVSRLARGLPHGGDLEFADPITVRGAFDSRTALAGPPARVTP
jgi:recombination protein RecR